jgi:hypothetical protein
MRGTFVLYTFLVGTSGPSPCRSIARATFERSAAYAKTVGLWVEPASSELPGDFPQAFRDIGMVNAPGHR